MTDKKTTFTDAKGRTWAIDISDKALRHVSDAGLDFKIGPEMRLAQPVGSKFHENDLLTHQQIIFALIEQQAIRLGVSWSDFRAAMCSQELMADAWEALNNAITARFPKQSTGRQDDDDTGELHAY